ncbi:TPA: flavodoxin domain-containing protein, partial [Neisseria meningitidis]
MSEHDMQNTNPPLPPLPPEITQLLSGLDAAQWAWLSGYAWAKAGNGASAGLPALQTALPTAEPFSVTVLSASQTGNAKSVADKAADSLEAAGIQVSRAELKDYKAKNIAGERRLLLVTSTQGEGEPPEEAVVLHKLLNGKKAPKLDKLQFAVLGLGDSSYPNFCRAGKDFDKRFEELGAKRLLERVDADLDFAAAANAWTDNIAALLKEEAAKNRATPAPQATPPAGLQTASEGRYCKADPFPAALLANQKITARQSDKDVRHIEIDLSGSDLHYLPGDALGVWFDNDPALVREILDLLGIDPATEIQAGGK